MTFKAFEPKKDFKVYLGSTFAVASSNTIMEPDFRLRIARARQTNCLWPILKLVPPSKTSQSRAGIIGFNSTLKQKNIKSIIQCTAPISSLFFKVCFQVYLFKHLPQLFVLKLVKRIQVVSH